MKIDATPAHPMRCTKIDQPSLNVAALAIEIMTPDELSVEMLRLSGMVRRGEVIDGARLVAVLKAAEQFLRQG